MSDGRGHRAAAQGRKPTLQPNGDLAPGAPARRILLVEDSYTNQRIATRTLERLGFEVVADNGLLALEAFSHSSYDAVLMDIMMPEMDGHECTREIRRRFPEPHIPIIALTANAMVGDRERCIEAGADDYISKPFKREDLVAALERWLGPAPVARDAQDQADLDSSVLDVSRLIEIGLVGPEADDSFSIVELFRDEARTCRQAMRGALAADDAEQLRRAAHMLKGGAANLGAKALATRAQEIERCGREGDLDQAEALVAALSTECDRVTAALERVELLR